MLGSDPPPPPARQVGQPQPKPPSRHGNQGGGGGGWANVLPCHPPPRKAIFFPPIHVLPPPRRPSGPAVPIVRLGGEHCRRRRGIYAEGQKHKYRAQRGWLRMALPPLPPPSPRPPLPPPPQFTPSKQLDFLSALIFCDGCGGCNTTEWVAPDLRDALERHEGAMIVDDYRPELVVSGYGPIRSLGLGVAAQIDLAEVLNNLAASLSRSLDDVNRKPNTTEVRLRWSTPYQPPDTPPPPSRGMYGKRGGGRLAGPPPPPLLLWSLPDPGAKGAGNFSERKSSCAKRTDESFASNSGRGGGGGRGGSPPPPPTAYGCSNPPPPPTPRALPGVIVFLMNARAKGGGL